MDHIKYKDINLIKTYEYAAMKYNILVELYNKLKNYISGLNGEILIDFNTDKYKQPVSILSPYENDSHKILLIKNTLNKEEYIGYKVSHEVEIIDIFCQEPNVNHDIFMMEMVYKTVQVLVDKSVITSPRIIVSKELISKFKDNSMDIFFKDQGFEGLDGIFSKKI